MNKEIWMCNAIRKRLNVIVMRAPLATLASLDSRYLFRASVLVCRVNSGTTAKTTPFVWPETSLVIRKGWSWSWHIVKHYKLQYPRASAHPFRMTRHLVWPARSQVIRERYDVFQSRKPEGFIKDSETLPKINVWSTLTTHFVWPETSLVIRKGWSRCSKHWFFTMFQNLL